MLIAKEQFAMLKGYKDIDAGTFTGKDGEIIPYDGFHQVSLFFHTKNTDLVEVRCRIANTEEGNRLYEKVKTINPMTMLMVDVEVQISRSGSAKYFLTSVEIC